MDSRALIISLFFVFSMVLCNAKIGQMDDYWRNKLDKANAASIASHQPEPLHVISHLNKATHHAVDKFENATRRSLRGRLATETATAADTAASAAVMSGACEATNPMDQCWRCKADWADNRKQLAKCALGFGHKTTGGLDGDFYVVTSPDDPQLVDLVPGTLRYGVTRDKPLWITFAHSMTFHLQQELIINGNKTIDGRGANIIFDGGAGFMIQAVQNVIVTNLQFRNIVPKPGGIIRASEEHYGFRTQSDGDGVSLFTASNVWVDHNSLANCFDGLIDAIANSTAITISNNYLTKHFEAMLYGAQNEASGDKIMQITVAFNHFGEGVTQRLPRVRYGFAHVLNNDYTHWLMYAIGGSQAPTLLVQGNRFNAPPNLPFSKEVTKRNFAEKDEWIKWDWIEEDNLYTNGAFFVKSGKAVVSPAEDVDTLKAKHASYVESLTKYAGVLNCVVGKPC